MTGSLLVQYLVIALAVLGSAGFVAKRQFPGLIRRLRIACALPLLRDGRPGWLRVIGRKIAPPTAGSGGACGTGCNGCGPAA